MRFNLLASGSKGNAALVEHREELVLVDCGISLRRLVCLVDDAGCDISDITALLITHEHGDHVRGLQRFAKQTGIIPHMTRGTAHALGLGRHDYHAIWADTDISIGRHVVARPYTIPHDAREAVHYRLEAEDAAVGFATDIGCPGNYIEDVLRGCNALVVECNYDPVMLEGNDRYPPSVKNRIRGGKGHLSNEQAALMLSKVADRKLRTAVAAHLSDNNNHPGLARKALAEGLNGHGLAPEIVLCPQGGTTGWIEVVPGG